MDIIAGLRVGYLLMIDCGRDDIKNELTIKA